MPQRILSISGLRGVIGDGLDPTYLVDFAAALGTLWEGGTVVLSRDGRSTGPMLQHAVVSALLATGCRVLDAGICSTPTCGVLVHSLGAMGGLQITASHNPVEWNGLKPFSPLGSVFDAGLGERLLSILEQKQFRWANWSQLGTVSKIEQPSETHRQRIAALVDRDRIAKRRFKVVLDCNHGSGGVFGPELLQWLGCDVTVLGGTPDGRFEHPPEPLAENLQGLCDAVRASGADVGFAQDPDADRLAIVDETGRYIGEELTLALCVDQILANRKGPVVVNGSTSRVSADLAEKYGCPFYRSHVGEANVVSRMREVGAVIGGEGNGGLIEPKVGYVRDSFASMAYVLAGLLERQQPLSHWVDSLPRYTILKEKLTCPRETVGDACAALSRRYQDAVVTSGDGMRWDWPDRWLQVRASNTEPIIRVIVEAPDEVRAQELCREAMQIVKQVVV